MSEDNSNFAVVPASADEEELGPHSRNSTLRENIAEHLFTGELLRRLWQRGIYDAEILHSEFDAGGYDLVLSRGKLVRHIQLKTAIASGKAARVNISLRLAEKPSGCVVWMMLDEDLTIKSYRWFGAAMPGDPLPDIQNLKLAKHTKGDASGKKTERPNLRVVERRRFTEIDTLDELLRLLLGDLMQSHEVT